MVITIFLVKICSLSIIGIIPNELAGLKMKCDRVISVNKRKPQYFPEDLMWLSDS
jgi:hypothetical protein